MFPFCEQRALARVDAAPPPLASTRSARLASGAGLVRGRAAAQGGGSPVLALPVAPRCAPRSGDVRRRLASLDRAAGRLRRPGRCPVDRRLLADLAHASARPRPARWPAPSPLIGRGYLQQYAEGGAEQCEARGRVPPPPRIPASSEAEASRHDRSRWAASLDRRIERCPTPEINGLLAYGQVPFGARGGSSLDWPPGRSLRFCSIRL